MKKILILSSSPRRHGNSDVLCDQFMKGALEAGHEVEKVFLRDHKIDYCTGCGVCNESHRCVLHDDAESIVNKMVEADVIVLATPVYFYSMCGQLKTLIDRTVPRYTEMRNKEFYYILTAADEDEQSLERTVSALRGFTLDCLENPKECGILYGVGAWQIGEIQSTPTFKQAYEMGKHIR